MKKMRIALTALVMAVAGICGEAFAGDVAMPARYEFGPGGASGVQTTAVDPGSVYSKESGWGFDLGTKQDGSGRAFAFSVGVAEGNYKVTVTFGGEKESNVTVKAEHGRLMLEGIHTRAGESRTESFVVNVRRPEIAGGGAVGLDSREMGSSTWDEKLTLAFSGENVAVKEITLEKADVPTIFVLGDSTVTDQGSGGGSWAQSLPRWFTEGVAVANHAESGETLKAFRRPAEKRWDKVLSQLKPGDWVFMQFGTNDSKQHGNNNIYPDEDFSSTYSPADTEFKALLEKYAAETKAKGATPVIVSCMGRRADTKANGSLSAYAQAAMAAAKEFGCPAIDLNAMSIVEYAALGQADVGKAFNDGTHPNNYGGYLLSRCIVEGIKADKLELAKYLRADAGSFDPEHPVPLPEAFKQPVDVGARGGPRDRRAGTVPSTRPGA